MATYKEAEGYLKDYLSGSLDAQIEKRKLEILYPDKKASRKDLREEEPDPRADSTRRNDRLEREVISYVDDGTYVYLKSKANAINGFLEFIKRTEKDTHRILLLFYYHNQQWAEVEKVVNVSASGCRSKRRNAIIELQKWI